MEGKKKGGGPDYDYAKMRRPKTNNPARWLKRSAFAKILERATSFYLEFFEIWSFWSISGMN
jgi:hypothetical protein